MDIKFSVTSLVDSSSRVKLSTFVSQVPDKMPSSPVIKNNLADSVIEGVNSLVMAPSPLALQPLALHPGPFAQSNMSNTPDNLSFDYSNPLIMAPAKPCGNGE